jgi:hypothetical protein
MLKLRKIKVFPKGFTLVEAIISTALLITFISLLTNMLFNFNKSSNVNIIKTEMDMDLRKAIERLEKEVSPARDMRLADTVNGIDFASSNAEIVFQIPSYDIDNYPLYEATGGSPQFDKVGIRMGQGTENVTIMDPITKIISPQKVRKLIFTIEPVAASRRKKIENQSIFEYYIPIDLDPASATNGEYTTSNETFPGCSSTSPTCSTGLTCSVANLCRKACTTDADCSSIAPGYGCRLDMGTDTQKYCRQVLKLFSFYGENNQEITSKVSTVHPNISEARTVKIVLMAQKSYGGTFMTAKRETEIRLRNSTY